ncbi:MAG: TetR family transcriptional regulator [Chthonomonadaceae bacterium]|nr:TetR family transcriptional regulator [Chthonomonadaceae bacterium]
MASAERREREKANLRRAILDAARELFVTEDFHAVSMRRIAEKIEYSPTAIYLYFKDKEEILAHLASEGFAMLADRFEALDNPDPIERLREGGRIYIDFARTQTQYFQIMFQIGPLPTLDGAEAADDPGPCGSKSMLGMRTFGFIVDCVEEANRKGLLRPFASENIAAHVVWAQIHGAAALMLSGRLGKLTPEAYEPFLEELIETTLRGMRA